MVEEESRRMRKTKKERDEAIKLLKRWLADYNNESWPFPATETVVFLKKVKAIKGD